MQQKEVLACREQPRGETQQRHWAHFANLSINAQEAQGSLRFCSIPAGKVLMCECLCVNTTHREGSKHIQRC